MPLITTESYEAFHAAKKVEHPLDLMDHITRRKRRPYRYEPRQGEVPFEQDTINNVYGTLIEPYQNLPEQERPALPSVRKRLGRSKGTNHPLFMTHLYHAVRYDRPDAILAINRKYHMFGPQEKAFLGRAYLAAGQSDEAKAIADKLKEKETRGKDGLLELLIAMRRFDDAKKMIRHLKRKDTGIRMFMRHLLNAPYSSEMKPMLDFADSLERHPVLQRSLRLQVIRASIHKHQISKALDLYKKYHHTFERAVLRKTGITKAAVRIQELLNHHALTALNNQLKPLAKASKEDLKQKTDDFINYFQKQYAPYFSTGKALRLLVNHLHGRPVICRIYEESEDAEKRSLFDNYPSKLLKSFRKQGRSEEFRNMALKAAETSSFPDYGIFATKLKLLLGEGKHREAFDLYKQWNQKKLKQLVASGRISLSNIRKLQKQIVDKNDQDVEKYFRDAEYLPYPPVSVQLEQAKQVRAERKKKSMEKKKKDNDWIDQHVHS